MTMKNIIISLTLSLCFFKAFAQNNAGKTTSSNSLTISELLIGKWQALDDKNNFLVFDKNERKEIGGGMTSWDSEPYVLSNKCMNEGDKENGIEPEKDKYISCVESDLCWYIISVNKDFLTLSYMGRGNTLKYKRVN